jgi:pentatricopeptide repeat domain-containing protein 1
MNKRGPNFKPNLVCYNAAMKALVRGNQAEKALSILTVVQSEGLKPDKFTCSTALKAFSMLKKWQEALEFLDNMPGQMGVEPNAHAYCAAINACEKGGQYAPALQLLERMQKRGVKPNTVTFTSVISACKACGQHEDALRILHSMKDIGVQPDAHTYTNAISACDKAGRWAEAKATFDEMCAKGLVPTLITYGALLRAYENGNQWSKSLALLKEMPMKPDRIAYHSVIGACSKANRWSEAVEVVEKMITIKVVPYQKTFDLVASMCLKAGQFQEARAVCDRAHNCGVEVSTRVQERLAMQIARGDWEEASGMLLEMEAKGLEPSCQAFNTAGQACKAAGQQQHAMKMWRRSRNWTEAVALLHSADFEAAPAVTQAGLRNDALYVCGKGDAWEQARDVYLDMDACAAMPTTESIHAAIDALNNANQYAWARFLSDINTMTNSSVYA